MRTMEANAEPNGTQPKRAAKLADSRAKDGSASESKGEAEVAPSKTDARMAPDRTKWSTFKDRVESAWTHLEVAFRDLTSRTARALSRWMNPPAA